MDFLDRLTTFVRVVEGKSLSAAARALRVSLPAVSRNLRALELSLGVALVVRSTRRLHLTEAGQELYPRAVRLLRDAEEARSALRTPGAVRGTLVVSASITFGAVVLVPRIEALLAAHPELEIDLRLEDHLVNLVGDGVDVALRAGSPPPDSTSYVAQPVFSMSRVLVAAPRWLKKRGAPRSVADLARRECLVQVTPSGHPIPWALVSRGEALTVDVRGRLRTHAPLVLRDLAREGAGIAYVPDWLVADDLREGRLLRVLADWASPPITAWAIYRTALRGAPSLSAFLASLPRGAPQGERGKPRAASATG